MGPPHPRPINSFCSFVTKTRRGRRWRLTKRESVASAFEKCTERFLERVPEVERQEARRYVEVTYCTRFAERGWVYDDGALSIEAHEWLEASGEEECVLATEPGEPARTVPCEDFDERGKMIRDCGLLHYVRRSEVRDYIAELRHRYGDVRCDDGTPLEELGTP